MRKIIYSASAATLLFVAVLSCKKSSTDETQVASLTVEEKSLIASAGFNSNWSYKTDEGKYLIEGDILLTKDQLQSLSGVAPAYELIAGQEEHYRTTNLVNTGVGVRTITVRLGSGFLSHYSTGLDQALARYNSLGLNIVFQRVTTGGDIVISGANLGRVPGGGCVLGQAAGFPTGGNPAPGFTLSTNKCATNYLGTANAVDEVIAHEIGHCIGFRHTDFMNRSSCGQNSNEGAAGVGAIHIPGTPETVTGSYNSWMMACINNNPAFSADDATALQAVY